MVLGFFSHKLEFVDSVTIVDESSFVVDPVGKDVVG